MAPQKADQNIDYDALAKKYGGTDAPVDYDALAAKYGGVDALPSLDSLTANTKKQGTYRMLPPAGQEQSYGKIGVMIPYGNINSARQQGFAFDPSNGDDTRYAHDLFTELKGKGQAPTVESPDEPLVNQYGVVPTPAPGSKEWLKRQGIKTAHAGIDLLPTVGMIAGGLATGIPGAATGPGDILIAGAGAAGGSAMGEALRQDLNRTFFGENQNPNESAKHMAEQAALGFGMETGGRAIGIPLALASNTLGFTAEESAKAAIPLLGSEARGKAPTWMEEVLKGNILSSGIMEKFRTQQNKESLAAVNTLMDTIAKSGGTPEQQGKMAQEGLAQAAKDFHDQQNSLYKWLDDVTEKKITTQTPVQVRVIKDGKIVKDAAGNPVMRTIMQPRTDLQVMPSMSGLKKFAQEKLDQLGKPPHFLPKDALEQAREIFNTIKANPDNVSFERMRQERSALAAMGRKLEDLSGSPKGGLTKKLTKLVDQSLEDAAKKSPVPGVYDRWREANALTAEWHRMTEGKLLEKVAETENPEFISSFISGNKVGLQQTRDLFNVLPQKLHDPVRRGVLEDAVSRAIDSRTGAFDEGKFASYVDKMGDERCKVIFGQNWKNIKELVDIIGKINGPVGLAKGGGAALLNTGLVKRLATVAFSVPMSAIALGAGTGHLESGLMGAGLLGGAETAGLAATVVSARTVAWAMVNPAKAAKMLAVARAVLHETPYAASTVYHIGKSISPRELKDTEELIKKTLHYLIDKAKGPAPAAQGPIAYNHYAVNPATGHHIGHDGQDWRDVRTGAKVA